MPRGPRWSSPWAGSCSSVPDRWPPIRWRRCLTVEGASAVAVAPDGRHVVVRRAMATCGRRPLDGGAPPRRLTHGCRGRRLQRPGRVRGRRGARSLRRACGGAATAGISPSPTSTSGSVPTFAIAHLGAAAPHARGAPLSVRRRAERAGNAANRDHRRRRGRGSRPGHGRGRLPGARGPGGRAAAGWWRSCPVTSDPLRWLRVTPDGRATELWTEQSRAMAERRPAHPRACRRQHPAQHGAHRLPSPGAASAEMASLRRPADRGRLGRDRGGPCRRGSRAKCCSSAPPTAPTERHLYAVPRDAAAPERNPKRLTAEPGWHAAVASRDGSHWADAWSDLEHAPSVTVRDRDGGSPCRSTRPRGTAASFGRRPPELRSGWLPTTATRARCGPLPARRHRPPTPPPCVVWVYGGPHAQYVKNAWEMTVIAAAPVPGPVRRGGAGGRQPRLRLRGLAFEAPLAGHFGWVEVADQAAAVRAAGVSRRDRRGRAWRSPAAATAAS